jgi:hypothetical protein
MKTALLVLAVLVSVTTARAQTGNGMSSPSPSCPASYVPHSDDSNLPYTPSPLAQPHQTPPQVYARATPVPITFRPSTSSTVAPAHSQGETYVQPYTPESAPPARIVATQNYTPVDMSRLAALSSRIRAHITEKVNEKRVESNVAHCQQNASGSVMISGGKLESCREELDYRKDLCALGATQGYCKLLNPAAQ